MKLKEYLKENRWSIREVSRILNIEYQGLIYIVNEKRNPSPVVAEKLSRFTKGEVTPASMICIEEQICPHCGKRMKAKKSAEKKPGSEIYVGKRRESENEKKAI